MVSNAEPDAIVVEPLFWPNLTPLAPLASIVKLPLKVALAVYATSMYPLVVAKRVLPL